MIYLKGLKEKHLQPRVLYQSELKLRRNFSDKQTLKKFFTTKLTLKEMIQYLSKLRRNNNKKTCESVNLTGKSKYILRIAD